MIADAPIGLEPGFPNKRHPTYALRNLALIHRVAANASAFKNF
jgi:hypothetical protein